MESEVTEGVLEVDDASLYYERRGQGPALLMIAGAGGDAGMYRAAADLLASDYTVITYDRRGNSRSKWRGPVREFRLLEHASDAVAVLHANGFDSATVLGQSGGAAITLSMVAAFPHTVERAIAHEPPIVSGLPDRTEIFDWYDHLEDLGLQGNEEQAGAEFVERCGLTDTVQHLFADPAFTATLQRFMANIPYFVREEMAVFTHHRPDYPRLRSTTVPLHVGIGRESLNMHGPGDPVFYALAAQRTAERIGAPVVEFPGNHLGFMVDATAFVDTLRPLLRQQTS